MVYFWIRNDTSYVMNLPPQRIPNRTDLIQMGRQTHAAQRSFRAATPVVIPANLKLLDQLRYVCRGRHYSLRTEEAYVMRVRKFLLMFQSCLANERFKCYLMRLKARGVLLRRFFTVAVDD
jgi:hypothetical protein